MSVSVLRLLEAVAEQLRSGAPEFAPRGDQSVPASAADRRNRRAAEPR